MNVTRAHHTLGVVRHAIDGMPIRDVLTLLQYLWLEALRHVPKSKRTDIIDAMVATLVNAGDDMDAECDS